MFARVYSVESVVVRVLKSNPPQLVLTVCGRASSSGWSDPELGVWMYIRPPSDGILDFDFLARSPGGISLPYLTPICASVALPIPSWVRGVRIHAASNTMQHDFGSATFVNDGPSTGARGWSWLGAPDDGGGAGGSSASLMLTGLPPPPNRGWAAWENRQPPGPPRLHVIGEVETTNSAIVPILSAKNPDGHLCMLELEIVDTGENGSTDVSYRKARYSQPVRLAQFTEVRIVWQGTLLIALPVRIVS